MSSSAGGRGRGGKFSKPKRGGGKHFSRDLQPLNADGEVVGMWGEQPVKEENEDDDDEEESSEEESEDEGPQQELSREERRAAAKARKAAAIAKKSQKVAEPGDLPSSSEEEDEEDDGELPSNPNHTAKARSQAAAPKVPVAAEASTPKAKADGKAKTEDLSQLSRREREAIQAQQSKERYEKLHAEGKTDQARADLERLALVRERREAESARKKAEAEERAEQEKAKAEQMEKEAKRRDAAMGSKKGGKAGKKKA
ncbi:hypothetical protein P154DRAFT_516902 [Amniculicola lignicola CBS 123094]|uniref:Casein kinase substrate phosphoprotein PP28 domain-containing protein n=1 Tax=Amniculicola lignicola CBS 123094 TaxID=1392246 RepID=A0A6A5X5G4_9PLEO|nr:hypothetical protein P154DRAFT_516902 [Amniculicola lignicola CBS 123094]